MIDLSQETEALARRVADARHVTIDAAVRQALEASAQAVGVSPEPLHPRDPSLQAVTLRRERLNRIVGEIATLPVLDKRPLREIVDDLNAV